MEDVGSLLVVDSFGLEDASEVINVLLLNSFVDDIFVVESFVGVKLVSVSFIEETTGLVSIVESFKVVGTVPVDENRGVLGTVDDVDTLFKVSVVIPFVLVHVVNVPIDGTLVGTKVVSTSSDVDS